VLDAMPPFLGGGDMIRTVTFERSTWNDLPYKFEAGTPNIEGAIGLGAAIDYVRAIGFERIGVHEAALLTQATAAIESLPGVRVIGTARRKASVLSFVMDGIHPHDIGTVVDRTAWRFAPAPSASPSWIVRHPGDGSCVVAMSGNFEDIDALVTAVGRAQSLWVSWECFLLAGKRQG
jgi:cysteine desulfurase/selenocysteine lyase